MSVPTTRAGVEGAAALLLGTTGVVLITLAPTPLALVGATLFVAAVGVRPWTVTPLLILTLPFHLHPRLVGGLEVSATEATLGLGFVAVLVSGAIRRRGAETGRLNPSAVDWGAALFLGAAVISLFVTEYPRQSLRELRWLIVEPVALFYLARWTLASARIEMVLWSMVAAGMVAATLALWGLVSSGDLLHVSVRAVDPYLSPNHLGIFLGRTMAVALALALFANTERRPPLRPWAGWLAFGLMGLALFRTTSVGAWVGVGVAILILVALRGRRGLVITATGLVVVAVLAFAFLPPDRTFQRFDPNTGTGLFRLQIWGAAVRMITDHPLLGVGLDNFLYLYQGGYMLPEAWEEPNISHPHNLVLHFWLQLGLPGLAAFLALTAWTAQAAHRRFWRAARPLDRALGAAVLGTMIDLLVHGAFDNSYFLVDSAMVWWLMIALLLIAERKDAPAEVPRQLLQPPSASVPAPSRTME